MPQNFDFQSFIAHRDQKNETRVARSLFPLLLNRRRDNDFTCDLAPVAFDMPLLLLNDSVNHLMKQVGLDAFASITNEAGKVALTIPAGALMASPVQANISAALAKAHQHAAQLSI